MAGQMISAIQRYFDKPIAPGYFVHESGRQRHIGIIAKYSQLRGEKWLIQVMDPEFSIPGKGHYGPVILHYKGVPMPGHGIKVKRIAIDKAIVGGLDTMVPFFEINFSMRQIPYAWCGLHC
jgi:hypothetical protein